MDVSGHQTLTQVQAALANPKYGYVIAKATEGLTFDSSGYAAQIAAVRASSKVGGAYHFAWLNQDPLLEAAHFVKTAAPAAGELVCLDLEDWGETDPTKPNYARDKAMRDATPWTQRLDYAIAWCAEVKRLTGATPLVYANWTWIKGLRTAAGVVSTNNWASTDKWAALTSYPLWIADYTTPGAFSTVNGGWPVVMQQWTANDGGLDGDYMPDPAAWAKYAKP